MDTDRLMELAPHYLAMFLLVFLVIAMLETIVGDFSFWLELVIVFVVVFAYRPLVIGLGIAPSDWE
jgi:uncharacterized membrane protein